MTLIKQWQVYFQLIAITSFLLSVLFPHAIVNRDIIL